MRKNMIISILSFATIVAGTASADIISLTHPVGGPAPHSAFVTIEETFNGSNHWVVTIESNTDGIVIVSLDSDDPAGAENDIIDRILIVPNFVSTNLDRVVLTISKGGSGVLRSGIQGVKKIDVQDSINTHVKIRRLMIEGNLGTSSSSGSIEVAEIEEIEISGNLLGEIIVRNELSSDIRDVRSIIIEGDVAGGSIFSHTGKINHIQVGTSTVVGSVYTFNGRQPAFWSNTEIQNMSLWGDVQGRIGGSGTSGGPDIGWPSINGDFDGTAAMSMKSLGQINTRHYNAIVSMDEAMDPSKAYDIYGAFEANAKMSLPANGLTGQIFVNKADIGSEWESGSEIIVGGTTLGPVPYYTQLSAELGGGAVGEAPFNFHQRTTAPPANVDPDCVPHQNELYHIDSFGKLGEVMISHYGPVYADGPGPHFRVEYKPAWGTGVPGSDPLIASWSWEDKTSLFEIDTDSGQSGTTDANAQTKIVIKGSATNGEGFKVVAGQWRIRPIAGKVKCGGVIGNPNVEYDSNYVDRDLGAATGLQYSWYHFNTGLASISGSMLITGDSPSANDLSEWLIHPYEVNADGEIDYQDFVDIAEGYVAD